MKSLLTLLTLSILCWISSTNAQNPIASTPLYAEISQFRWISDRISMFLSSNRRLYRSDDEGSHFADITDRLFNATYTAQAPEYIYVSTVDPSMIYVRGRGGLSWRSDDAGATWDTVYPRQSFRNFVWHPTESGVALSTVFRSSDDRTAKLYLTKDFGQSWNLIHSSVFNNYPTSYGWIDAGTGDVPKFRITFVQATSENDDRGGQREAYHLVQTDDEGVTFQMVHAHVYAFITMQRHLYIAAYTLSRFDTVLKVTYNLGSFVKQYFEAEFPFGDTLDYEGFVLLDDTAGAVFVAISHVDTQRAAWGNLYLSDSSGVEFDISMEHIQQEWPSYDFDVVEGLEGIYLVNYLSNWNTISDREQPKSTTYLSFDNGAEWWTLDAPDRDSNGNPFACSISTTDCSLNLHGWTQEEDFGPFYSRDSAIGIILATGNVGRYLSHDKSKTSTFLSTDAGLTWRELIKKNTIYEIGDHGGLIVLAPMDEPTDTIYYTIDLGSTAVRSFRFITGTRVNIENIIIEPSSTGRKFVLYGDTLDGRGIVVGLDFSRVHTRDCDEDDYEIWSPSAGRKVLNNGTECLLGRITNYNRRKVDRDCFNPRDLDPMVGQTNCQCTIDDYECDVGYDRDTNGVCVWTEPNPPVVPPKKCQPGAKYNVTKGYRLIALDSCVDGVDLRPIPTPCPGSTSGGDLSSLLPSGMGGGAIAVIVIVVILSICCIIGLIFAVMNSEKLRNLLPFGNRSSGPYFGSIGGRQSNTLLDEDDLEIRRNDSDEELSTPAKPQSTQSQRQPDLIKIVEQNKSFSLNDDDFNPRSKN